jgi:hypothetical protein
MALVTFGTGLLLGLGTGVGLSGPLTRDQVAPDAATAYTQVLQQHTARLTEVERSFQQHMARLVDIEQALAASTHTFRNAPPALARTDGDVVASFPDATVLRQEVNRLLRDELREVLAAVGTGTPRGPEDRAQAEEAVQTQENREAFDAAYDIVENALTVGRWTDDDGHNFRHAMASLTSKQRQELLEFLLPAVNRGEIQVETVGPLF